MKDVLSDRGSNNRPVVMMVSLVVKEGDLRRAGRRKQEIFTVMLNLGWYSTSPKKNKGHQLRCRLAYLRYFLFKCICFWQTKLC